MIENNEQKTDDLQTSSKNARINEEYKELEYIRSLADIFGEAGISHLIARYNSNKTFLGVIFGFAIAAFVALIVHISSSHIVIANLYYAYNGLVLLAIVMSVSGSITIIEVYRYDSMWPLSQVSVKEKHDFIERFADSISKSQEQLKRITICRWQEFAEALLVSALILSIGFIAVDLIDVMLGEVIVASSIMLWVVTIMMFARVVIPILSELLVEIFHRFQYFFCV